MGNGMIWIAGVLAVFLFYQFVESQHKIYIAKFTSVIVGLICIGGGAVGFYLWNANKLVERQEALKQKWISAEFAHRKIVADPGKVKLWKERVFDSSEFQEAVPDRMAAFIQNNVPDLKEALFNEALDQQGVCKRVTFDRLLDG